MTAQTELFHNERRRQVRDTSLDQYFTPEWAAAELVHTFFPDLGKDDVVIEPSCGRGAFLKAIPLEVEAVGVEIDKTLAIEARENTGRKVVWGDYRTVEVPTSDLASVIVGNPPYDLKLFEQFLAASTMRLRKGGRCGFLLSSHMLQTPSTVLRWSQTWGLSQHIVPRTLFPRAIRPLVFVTFDSAKPRQFSGFALYKESAEISEMTRPAKVILVHGEKNHTCWSALVRWALKKLGGRAPLKDIYETIAPVRPTSNPWWQAKVRQNLQLYHTPYARGIWCLK
jgi:hypothetical protein